MRSRSLAIVLVFLVAATAFTALAQDADKQNTLEDRVAALEKRLAALEQSTARQLRTMESRIAQGGADPLEGEASAAYAKITSSINSGKFEEAKTLMADFMKKYGATNTAKKATRTYQELSVIGKEPPTDWGIEKWYQGEKEVDLAGDKTTLLVFWEVWCPHCKREVPKMQQLYTTLKGEGLQMVGLTKITKSATEEKVTEFIAEQKVEYPMAKENGQVSSYFNVSGIPAAAVVKGGKVVWRGHPARLTEEMLKGWL